MSYGPNKAEPGERCSNADERYTCPGCYMDFPAPVSECPNCGAPLKCYIEHFPHYQCEVEE